MDPMADLIWHLINLQKSCLGKKPVKIFNKGKHERDFTYVTDVASSIIKLINKKPNKSFFK